MSLLTYFENGCILYTTKQKREVNKMDAYKMKTINDYTKYDINCKWVCPNKHETELKKKIMRKARRIMKQELKKNVMTFDD